MHHGTQCIRLSPDNRPVCRRKNRFRSLIHMPDQYIGISHHIISLRPHVFNQFFRIGGSIIIRQQIIMIIGRWQISPLLRQHIRHTISQFPSIQRCRFQQHITPRQCFPETGLVFKILVYFHLFFRADIQPIATCRQCQQSQPQNRI